MLTAALFVLALVLFGLAFFAFPDEDIFTKNSHKAERSALYTVGFLVLALFAFLGGMGNLTHNESISRKADTIFSNSAYSIFQVIRGEQDHLPSGNPSEFGKIFLSDSQTIVISANLKSQAGASQSAGLDSKNLTVNLPSKGYILTGSLTSDNKNWCFDLKEGEKESVYNQKGFVNDNTSGTDGKVYFGHSSCLDGVAYNSAGQAE